jgi:arsenate reductase
MFGVGQHISTRHRATGPHFLAEVVATGGLLALIFALARTQRGAVAAPAVGAYIGAAYWFTSSTSFANPAVTAGRIFSNTFAGIGPASALVFITAQLVGLVVGVVVIRVLYPDIAQSVAEVVLKGHWRMPDSKPTVLVSCIHNSGRSVAAAGFLRHLAGDRVNVISRGSDPGTGLNPQIVAAMAEVGIDVTDQTPTRLEDSDVEVSDVVITMACGESCTWFPGKRYEDWEVEDPKGKDLQTVRGIRDDIKARVETLLGELLRTGVIS